MNIYFFSKFFLYSFLKNYNSFIIEEDIFQYKNNIYVFINIEDISFSISSSDELNFKSKKLNFILKQKINNLKIIFPKSFNYKLLEFIIIDYLKQNTYYFYTENNLILKEDFLDLNDNNLIQLNNKLLLEYYNKKKYYLIINEKIKTYFKEYTNTSLNIDLLDLYIIYYLTSSVNNGEIIEIINENNNTLCGYSINNNNIYNYENLYSIIDFENLYFQLENIYTWKKENFTILKINNKNYLFNEKFKYYNIVEKNKKNLKEIYKLTDIFSYKEIFNKLKFYNNKLNYNLLLTELDKFTNIDTFLKFINNTILLNINGLNNKNNNINNLSIKNYDLYNNIDNNIICSICNLGNIYIKLNKILCNNCNLYIDLNKIYNIYNIYFSELELLYLLKHKYIKKNYLNNERIFFLNIKNNKYEIKMV